MNETDDEDENEKGKKLIRHLLLIYSINKIN